jgi:hypothetical protein
VPWPSDRGDPSARPALPRRASRGLRQQAGLTNS